MNDRAILLRAICTLPEDDAPRLAYADWLDENNDPRQAEFIRVQIELAHLAANAPQRAPLRDREQQLWRELKKWRFILGDWLSFSLTDFQRGFNTRWHGTAQDIIKNNCTFWRNGPVTNISFSVHSKISLATEAGTALAACDVLQSFRNVAISGRGLTDAWVATFLQSPYLVGWHRLHLDSDQLTDATCRNLADSDLPRQGCRLHLISTQATPQGRALLTEAHPREPPPPITCHQHRKETTMLNRIDR